MCCPHTSADNKMIIVFFIYFVFTIAKVQQKVKSTKAPYTKKEYGYDIP